MEKVLKRLIDAGGVMEGVKGWLAARRVKDGEGRKDGDKEGED